MEVTLFLMSKKGYNVLKDLIEAGYASLVSAVVVSHDYNMADDFYDEIFSICKENRLIVYDRNDGYTIESAYCIAISWRWLIPIDENIKLIVLHDSILPKYRGYSPLVNMLLNRERYLGVTAFFAKDHYDNGDIVTQRTIEVHYPIKILEAINLISRLYSEIVLYLLSIIRSQGQIKSIPQNEEEATYSLWRDSDDYRVDWNSSSHDISHFVYCVGYPFQCASSLLNKELVRIADCELYKDLKIENRCPGKVLFIEDGYPIVVCGSGLIKIKELKDEKGHSLLPFKKIRSRFS